MPAIFSYLLADASDIDVYYSVENDYFIRPYLVDELTAGKDFPDV